ncbi:hypothetical protein JW921_00570 [Candidatus Fermentibacterales bacterium]|nr:hypothetical protein [Candidatus Fermentibacterales bacterium]
MRASLRLSGSRLRGPAPALLCCALAALLLRGGAQAHGARILWEADGPVVRIEALYDDGTPMAGAQVIVYSPADPSEPWLHGATDDTGRFCFEPDDREASGTWDVQVRQAGHGDIVHVDLVDPAPEARGGGGPGTLQMIVMAVCVGWGFVGTFFFFSWRAHVRKQTDARS